MRKYLTNRHFLLGLFLITIFSCYQSKLSDVIVIKFDTKLIDSLKKNSDTIYNQVIRRTDFYDMDYYINKGDSITTKILKDSLGNVVGLNSSKNGRVLFASEYYSNGQLKGKTQFLNGKIEGPALYFYSDGRIKGIGQWHDYKQLGVWKDYDEQGRLEKITNYDDSGNIIRTELIRKE